MECYSLGPPEPLRSTRQRPRLDKIGNPPGREQRSQGEEPTFSTKFTLFNDLAKVVVSHKHFYPTTTPDSNKVTVLFCERS